MPCGYLINVPGKAGIVNAFGIRPPLCVFSSAGGRTTVVGAFSGISSVQKCKLNLNAGLSAEIIKKKYIEK
jgi:hypothetical protein